MNPPRKADGLLLRRFLLFAFVLGAVGACGGTPIEHPFGVQVRLTDPDPRDEFFSLDRLVGAREITLDRPIRNEEARSWRVDSGGPPGRVDDDGFVFLDSTEPLILSRSLDLDTAEFHAIGLEVDGENVSRIRLCWSRPGESMSSLRCEQQRRPTRGNEYIFPVAKHPLWKDRIERLQVIIVPADPVLPIRFCRLFGERHSVDSSSLAEAVGRAWKVTLEGETYRDTRTALPAPPGREIRRRLVLPPSPSLDLAYGLQTGVPQAVSFEVAIQTESGQEKILLEDRIEHSDPIHNAWRDARIDLGEFAGEEVDLILRVSSDDFFDLLRGLPFWGHPNIATRREDSSRPNVVMILLDTVRADHLSLYGYSRPTTPRLETWASECATTFEQAVAAAPWTIPSHTSIFTGLEALQHGVNHETRVAPDLVFLAETLREAGYSTAGITGGGYLNASYGFSRGFDRYAAWKRLAESEDETETGVDRALDWLESHKGEPFFLFLHTYGAHTPYRPREPYLSQLRGSDSTNVLSIGTRMSDQAPDRGFPIDLDWIWLDDPSKRREGTLLSEDEMDWPTDLYDSELAHLDSQVGRFLDGLDRLGLGSNTVVVLTSDHGEHLGEAGLVGHTTLYDGNLLVPLVVALPGCTDGGARIEDQVRSIDLTPTILDLAEVAPSSTTDGVSLAPWLRDASSKSPPREAWSYSPWSNRGISLRLGHRLKYIFNNTAFEPLAGEEELYEFAEDSRELENLAPEDRRLPNLRREAVERLSSTKALRLSFLNQESSLVEGRITPIGPGWAKLWSKVKSHNLSPGSVRWIDGTIAIEVPPETAYSLSFETPGSALQVELESDGESLLSTRLAPDSDITSWSAFRQGTSWRLSPGSDGNSPAFLTVNWPTAVSHGLPHESPEDPEILRELRALGYVD